MKRIFLLLVLFAVGSVSAQTQGKLSGTITDQEVFNEGVVFVDVSLKNTEFKTQTNFRGNFEIQDITPGTYTLVVNYIGYETLEIPVVVKADENTYFNGSIGAKQLSLDELNTLVVSRESPLTSEVKSDEKLKK